MNALATLKMFPLVICMIAPTLASAAQKEVFETSSANVRVMRHPDGSKTSLTRSPDGRTITKIKKDPNGVLTMRTVYRMDRGGDARGCKIYDGQNVELFKVSYGYRKSDGQLVEERMFDSRTPRMDPNTGKEMPIQITQFTYSPQGERSAPQIINMLPGKTFEQVFGLKTSELGTNPFKDQYPGRANPNSRPAKR